MSHNILTSNAAFFPIASSLPNTFCAVWKKLENGELAIPASVGAAASVSDNWKEPFAIDGPKGCAPNLTLVGNERES